MHAFIEAQHAAEIAMLGMAARSLLARAVLDEAAVVSLAFIARIPVAGIQISVFAEFRDGAGNALGGWEL